MYRHSAQLNGLSPRLSRPAADTACDSDPEIVEALDRKRRQLDEDVKVFSASKDREFREFEKELRAKRRKSKPHNSPSPASTPVPDRAPTKNASSSSSSSSSSNASAAVLNLLAGIQSGSVNGCAATFKSKTRDAATESPKVVKAAPLSRPTLSLDRLNITTEPVAPPRASDARATSSLLTRPLSPTPPNSSGSITPPRKGAAALERPPPTPTSDRSDGLAGVFTPAYLPLLESRDHASGARPPPPARPEEEKLGRRASQPDREMPRAADVRNPELESSHSLPPKPVSPTIVATKRTRSAGQLPTARVGLPSALRTPSKSGRKGKHVTFQLADSTVVEPSSSYEESSSPAVSPDMAAADVTEVQPDAGAHGGLPPSTGKRSSTKKPANLLLSPHLSPGPKERKRGRFLSPMPSPLPSPAPSPHINGDVFLDPPHDDSGFSGGFAEAPDGGSGVGFFELDEELASPGLREGPPADGDPAMNDVDMNLTAKADDDNETQGDGFAAGSVPIDIVRPTGSWVGSFGH